MQEQTIGLFGLFLSAFISSTIAPGGSEVVLTLMLADKSFNAQLLVCIASIGNTLGALSTWLLGMFAAKKFSATRLLSKSRQKDLNRIKKWGVWALLFSWLPVIGDGLCFAGGWLKLPWLASCVAIFSGKVARYAVVAYFFTTWQA